MAPHRQRRSPDRSRCVGDRVPRHAEPNARATSDFAGAVMVGDRHRHWRCGSQLLLLGGGVVSGRRSPIAVRSHVAGAVRRRGRKSGDAWRRGRHGCQRTVPAHAGALNGSRRRCALAFRDRSHRDRHNRRSRHGTDRDQAAHRSFTHRGSYPRCSGDRASGRCRGVGGVVDLARRSKPAAGRRAHGASDPRARGALSSAVRQPKRLALLLAATAGVKATNLLALLAATWAFDGDVADWRVVLVYLVGVPVAEAVPTPGGFGAVDAVLVASLARVGSSTAGAVIAAVIVFRLLTFWAPILPGVLSAGVLRRQHAL